MRSLMIAFLVAFVAVPAIAGDSDKPAMAEKADKAEPQRRRQRVQAATGLQDQASR